MLIVGSERLERLLPYPELIDELARGFAAGAVAPPRSHHALPGGGSLLLMPAWQQESGLAGVKVVGVFPGNPPALGAVQASYLLLSLRTGEPLAVLDGGVLTARRTAAVSALAAARLAREDAERLLIVGTGRLAPELARAHATVRRYREVVVWGRRAEAAAAVAARLQADGLPARAAAELQPAVEAACVVACATLAREPLVRGAWLAAGSHLDLVGAFTPEMRECDDNAVAQASVWVDTRSGALAEAGDLLSPLRRGSIGEDHVRGELRDLVLLRGAARARREERTVFKSVGTALADLAAASLAWRQAAASPEP